jgi:hypothetical protein
LYLHMEASQHSLLAACFTLHSINATLAIVPQRGAGLWISEYVTITLNFARMERRLRTIVKWLSEQQLACCSIKRNVRCVWRIQAKVTGLSGRFSQ